MQHSKSLAYLTASIAILIVAGTSLRAQNTTPTVGATPPATGGATTPVTITAPVTITVPLATPGSALSAVQGQAVLTQYQTLRLQLLEARQEALLQASQASTDAGRRKVLVDWENSEATSAAQLHRLAAQITEYNQGKSPTAVLKPSASATAQ